MRNKPDETMITANGVQLCVETFGKRADEPVLLVMGAGASMLGWDDDFCRMLADSERFVIRYDQRDTGRSTTYTPGEPPYAVKDLALDVIGVIDAFDIEAVNLVGMSMGAWVCQLATLDHPDRVKSLTLISATPGGPGDPDSDLPPPSPQFLEFVMGGDQPDWTNRTQVVDYTVAFERVCAGDPSTFDEPRQRVIAERNFDRSRNLAATMTNHFLLDGGDRRKESRGAIAAPTLILHGEVDPVFPKEHALAMQSEIVGSRLVVLPKVGHVLPATEFQRVVGELVTHTNAAESR